MHNGHFPLVLGTYARFWRGMLDGSVYTCEGPAPMVVLSDQRFVYLVPADSVD
jgi:hypothetical protein